MSRLGNWLGQTTTTVGSGPVSLDGTLPGYAMFSSIGDGDVFYTIANGNDRESGIGALADNVLDRTSISSTLKSGVYDESSPTALLLSGAAQVFCTLSKEAFISLASGDFESDGSVPMSGDLDHGGNRGVNAGDPVDDQDLVTKAYGYSSYLQIDGSNQMSGALRATAGSDWPIINNENGSVTRFLNFPSGGGANTTPLRLSSEEVEIAHGSTIVVRSLDAASGGLQINNTSTGAGFERVLTESDVASGSRLKVNQAATATRRASLTPTYASVDHNVYEELTNAASIDVVMQAATAPFGDLITLKKGTGSGDVNFTGGVTVNLPPGATPPFVVDGTKFALISISATEWDLIL